MEDIFGVLWATLLAPALLIYWKEWLRRQSKK